MKKLIISIVALVAGVVFADETGAFTRTAQITPTGELRWR